MPKERLGRLEAGLADVDFPLTVSVPLLAGLLSLPLHDIYPPLEFSVEAQREETLRLLVAVMTKAAEGQPVVLTVEDIHWADPSLIEMLDRQRWQRAS